MADLPNYSSRRFLIVDDEYFMLGLIERMLRQCHTGHIFKCEDAGTAFKMIKDDMSQVDCIISDCNMPVINGLQLLKAIRMGRNPKIPRHQPFILLTGYGDADLVKTALALDVSGYVVKPVPLEKLVSSINNALAHPVKLKDVSHYEKIEVPKVVDRNFNADVPKPKKVSSWIVMHQEKFRSSPTVQKNIAMIREEAGASTTHDEVKIKARRQCEVGKLQEGMVLADDIMAEEGSVLLRRGTALSAKLIQRLHEVAQEVGGHETVWVGELER